MIDKSYYLSKTEFSILTAIEKAGRFYCFDLDVQKETEEEKIIQSIYQIVKNGWGYLEGSRLAPCGEMKELIKEIVQSENVMEICKLSSGKILCYLGRRMVLLSMTANRMLRVSGLPGDELLSWLEEAFSLGEPYWNTEADAREDIKGNEALQREMELLENGQGKDLLQHCKAELVMRDVKTGTVLDKYMLVQGALNLWLIHVDNSSKILWLEPDSNECRGKMQEEWKERSR